MDNNFNVDDNTVDNRIMMSNIYNNTNNSNMDNNKGNRVKISCDSSNSNKCSRV